MNPFRDPREVDGEEVDGVRALRHDEESGVVRPDATVDPIDDPSDAAGRIDGAQGDRGVADVPSVESQGP